MSETTKPEKERMFNISINIPENYDYNIWKLIKMKRFPSKSEVIRTAIREFINREFEGTLELFNFFNYSKKEIKRG